ncbi:sensor domain-containing protein [Micromonospora sp. WMMD1128]|uniref:sensor histidine kinase n=1 Tax=unclassified Micromonospora TaxID=2617518 RepID=UPI00248B3FA8|nr:MULTISPECIES: sensor histidine kinase [unclassified Micromonospora]WBB76080.1 sensor domain-containing protein [Micromonospora sp. WMMD1128]WFE36136.1 sensor domain-containing protein [Micromonospora sp. WMMD975]
MGYVRRRVRAAVDALEHLVGGLGTAVLAWGVLLWALTVAAACLVGVGLLLAPGALRGVRSVADRERARLSRWGGPLPTPGPAPTDLRAALRDPVVRRELGWTALHAPLGFGAGIVGLALPLTAVQDVTFPLWFRLLRPEDGAPGIVWWRIDGLPDALAVGLLGLAGLVLGVAVGPALARVQAWPGRWLLAPPPGVDLSMRVAQLTATRAAALDAHAVELRRIERSLHDGTQNRLVAVNVLLGAARRALRRDPTRADEILERAQHAAEQALGELRTVVRGILPPVLDDRGLAGALAGLAGGSTVPCRLTVDVSVRCAAAVEATAYFVVAEALTNVVRHSGASAVDVAVRRERDRLLVTVSDNGHGDADETRGSGLTGIRRRVEAYDGRMTLTSPTGGPTRMHVELPCGS